MASQTQTTPYSSSTFNSVPLLPTRRDAFSSRNGKSFVVDTLGPIIRRHNLGEHFGVSLIHRHFDIDATEKLVEFNNVTTPWHVTNDTTRIAPGKDGVYETSWLLDSSSPSSSPKWMPYEFAFCPVNQSSTKTIINLSDEKYSAFLTEFTTVLQDNGMADILGLRAWPGEGFNGGLEFSAPKANIFLVPSEFEKEAGLTYSETMWFFSKGLVDGDCVCVCALTKNKWHLIHDHVSQ